MSNRIIVAETEKKPALFICKNRTIERVWVKEHMTVGRSTESHMADINLEAGFVSREHGIVEYDAPNTYYLDTGSKNGTYYNGVRLKTGEKVCLSDGDVLQIFSWNDGKREDFVSILYSTRYPDYFVPEILDIKNNTAEINIGDPDGMAGNTDFNAATFFVAQKGWAIAGHGDCRVFLNGKQAEKPKYLQLGDSVRIKNLYFWYTRDAIVYAKQTDGRQIQKSGLPSLRINIVERSVWQRTKKLMLLQNINMTIEPGEMVLILGGSGAGKTTFMNAVMGYEKAQGKIMHGDTDIYEDYESVKYEIGFVPQQDLVRGSNTVYNTLINAAEMKLPPQMKKEDTERRVNEVLKTFGLWEVRDHLVSKIAGGQRKRISVAIEYIADPSLFFLDEPDSGLDGPEAKKLMQNLRRIADEGKIVMVISHIPDRAPELFDKVIVLAKSRKDNCGHLAFFGGIAEAFQYFDTDSLEGVVKRINGDGLSDYYIDKYTKLKRNEV